MSKYKETRAARIARVRSYMHDNKAFSIIAVLIVIALICNFIMNRQQPLDESSRAEPETVQEAQEEAEQESWRFYPIDLVILAVGGGFCTFKIIEERRRAKEELN